MGNFKVFKTGRVLRETETISTSFNKLFEISKN